MASFKNDVFYSSNSPGSGSKLGNIKRDVIFNGSSPGSGRKLGNVKNSVDRKSTRLNSSHSQQSRMPSSA